MNASSFANLIQNGILFDSHCHLNEKVFEADRAEVVGRAEKAGVKAIIDMGINVDSSRKAVEDSKEFDSVYAAVGIDPEFLVPGSDIFDEEIFNLSDDDFDKWLDEISEKLKVMADNERVLMIGETGIDNYWLTQRVKDGAITQDQQNISLARQKKLFQMHCKLSNELHKPLSIHSRNAINMCLDIVKEEKVAKGQCVFHSLTLDIGDDENSFQTKVENILVQGYLIGVNGIVTFNNAVAIRDVYARIIGKPIKEAELKEIYQSGFIFETDAPFLAPVPKRGERNESEFIKYILRKNIS